MDRKRNLTGNVVDSEGKVSTGISVEFLCRRDQEKGWRTNKESVERLRADQCWK